MATYNGNSGDNYLGPLDTADTYTGERGSDWLVGGLGNDTLIGENKIDPLSNQGTDTGTQTSITYTNSSPDVMYIYGVYTTGAVTLLHTIPAGGSLTTTIWSNSVRVLGGAFASNDYYEFIKTNTAPSPTSYTLNANNADLLEGQDGNDLLYGQLGADTLTGGTGADTLDGGVNDDSLVGGTGNDLAFGGEGNDRVYGDAGDDTLNGGDGADTIWGGTENDQISGGSGNDSILGEDGNDRIKADAGNDTVLGGLGADTISDSIGDDSLLGEAGNDNIDAGSGNDYVSGGADNDTLDGDLGNDTIDGGIGSDLINAGDGADSVQAGDGDDTVRGQMGNDTIDGSTGNDVIFGNTEGVSEAPDQVTAGTVETTPVAGLAGAGGLDTTYIVNGVTYTATSYYAFDGLTIISQVQNDGSLLEIDRITYTDSTGTITQTSNAGLQGAMGTAGASTALGGNGLLAPVVDTVAGKQLMFLTSQNSSGITVWELGSNGIPVFKDGITIGNAGNLPRMPEVFETTSGQVVIYVARPLYESTPGTPMIDAYTYNPISGALSQNTALDYTPASGSGVPTTGFLSKATVDGNSFLVSVNSGSLTVYDINEATGAISPLATTPSNLPTTPANQPLIFTAADGSVYVVNSNTSAEEFAVYELGSDGVLTETDRVSGQGDFSYSSANFMDGQPVIITVDPSGTIVRVFTLDSAGKATLRVEIPGFTSDTRPPHLVFVDNKYYVVDPTNGNHVLLTLSPSGTTDNDLITAGIGNDIVSGGIGNDTISGDDGADTLSGDEGDDSLTGGAGVDSILGGDGLDTIDGGTENDTIDGGIGNDSLAGGAGADSILGGDGNDSVSGGTENDIIDGGLGDDTLRGDAGDDSIVGGAGADSIAGGDGLDTISGGTENDTIDGGLNNDILSGGAGADSIQGGDGADSISGGTENDTILGGAGADTLYGDAGADRILGGDGNDTVNGGAGTDTLFGDAGNDALSVGTGDNATGGADRDVFTIDRTGAANGSTFTLDGSTESTAAGETDDYDRIDMTGLEIVKGSLLQSLDADQNSYSGTMQVKDTATGNIFTINYSEIEEQLCFVRGTMIQTDRGEVAIEDLAVGDLVMTRENGLKPIMWIGSSVLNAEMLTKHPKLYPIRIRAGALGQDCPASDLIVSPQHRMLLRSRVAERMVGEAEVLVAAKQLLLIDGVDYLTAFDEVEYFHFLFDQHEIVYANGAETESLYTGPQAMKTLPEEQRVEIMTLFPELADLDYSPKPARKLLSGRLGRKLSMRLNKNGLPMVE